MIPLLKLFNIDSLPKMVIGSGLFGFAIFDLFGEMEMQFFLLFRTCLYLDSNWFENKEKKKKQNKKLNMIRVFTFFSQIIIIPLHTHTHSISYGDTSLFSISFPKLYVKKSSKFKQVMSSLILNDVKICG